MKGYFWVSWSVLHKREFFSFMEWPYSTKGNWQFISFVKWPYSTKGNFSVSWSDPTPWKVISQFCGVHTMKGNLWVLWSDPTPWKGIYQFHEVTLLYEREFISFMELPYSMKGNLSVSLKACLRLNLQTGTHYYILCHVLWILPWSMWQSLYLYLLMWGQN